MVLSQGGTTIGSIVRGLVAALAGTRLSLSTAAFGFLAVIGPTVLSRKPVIIDVSCASGPSGAGHPVTVTGCSPELPGTAESDNLCSPVLAGKGCANLSSSSVTISIL
jgi:hypothetical protein